MKEVRRGKVAPSYTSDNANNSDNDSFFYNNFNKSVSGWSQSQNSFAGRSTMTVDSGNVSVAFRKIHKIEADVACKHNIVKV